MLDSLPDPQARWSAVPTEDRCQVIPAGGERPCTQAGRLPWVRKGETPRPERGENRRLCREHDDERQRLYFKYKSAAAEANRLGMKIAQDTSFHQPAERMGREKLDEAIAMREKYARLIDDELRERESHRKRFIAEVDAGHAAWLRRRKNARAANSDALDRLRQRRDVLLEEGVYGDARRREAEEAREHQEEVERMRQGMVVMMQQEEADRQHAQRQRGAREEAKKQNGREEERRREEEARRHEEDVERLRQRMALMRQQEEADSQRAAQY